jgi:hypothetical protein
MKIRISTTLYDEMEPAMEDAVKNEARGAPDPSDPVYLKLRNATWRKSGIVIDANESEIDELRSRALYKVDVAKENMEGDPGFWRGQLAAWRALLKQINKSQTRQANPC